MGGAKLGWSRLFLSRWGSSEIWGKESQVEIVLGAHSVVLGILEEGT